MQLLESKNAMVGSRVKLAKPNRAYAIGRSNPAMGTQYECEGTITTKSYSGIYVLWDNGCSNSYKSGELCLSAGGNMKSIW
jgi:hypothetical protein